MQKIHSPSCSRNRQPIFDMFDPRVPVGTRVVEIGCGTGEHAAFICSTRQDLVWQPSDAVDDRFSSVMAWRDELSPNNVTDPIVIDLLSDDIPQDFDLAVCINTIHIAPFAATTELFRKTYVAGVERVMLYGPFRFEERPLEPSNEQFDLWLNERFPGQGGIRTFETICDIAKDVGFRFAEDIPMPANNHALWWERA